MSPADERKRGRAFETAQHLAGTCSGAQAVADATAAAVADTDSHCTAAGRGMTAGKAGRTAAGRAAGKVVPHIAERTAAAGRQWAGDTQLDCAPPEVDRLGSPYAPCQA